jgi:uncharacterized membrane protein
MPDQKPPQPTQPTNQASAGAPAAPDQPVAFQVPPGMAGMPPGVTFSPIGVGGATPIALQMIPQAQSVQLWQGQFPPPEAIERYEKVLPGAFDRIIAMAERLQAAQIDEGRHLRDFIRIENRRGQWFGFAVIFFALGCAVVALMLHYPWVSPAFLSVPVMAAAKALIDSAKAPRSLIATSQISPPSIDKPKK